MAQAKIVELSKVIADKTALVSEYLASNNLAEPSFAVDGPLCSLIPPEAVEIEAARIAHDELISQQAIARFKLTTAFPVGSEATFAQIGEACGLSESDTRRLLRHAIIKHIFCEPKPGVVAHNAVSRLLAERPVLLDWVGASTDDLWQAASQMINAMVKFPGSEEPNETGFYLANNTQRSIYEEFSAHPERARRFGSAMTLFTEGAAFDVKHVVNGFAWDSLGPAGKVVDLGGSHGAICEALAHAYPQLTFVVQDLEPVIASAPKLDAGVASRVQLQAHDFFTEQPVKSADAYFFRWILHNWSDKYAIKILQNLVPALKPGARIIVNDNILPPPGVLPQWREERLRSMDLTMKEIQNARERELDDWKALFAAADARFSFKSATQPPESVLFLLEFVWQA